MIETKRVEIFEGSKNPIFQSWQSLAGMNLGVGTDHFTQRELLTVASFVCSCHVFSLFWRQISEFPQPSACYG